MLFLIEDEPDIRESLQEILVSEGYDVHSAANGAEAQEALLHLPIPDLIILDLLMPVMNGREFRAWQLETAALAKVPVIVLSADSSQKPIDEKVLHLRKPIDLTELLAAIQRACA